MRLVRVDAEAPLPDHPRMSTMRVLVADGHRSFVEALTLRLEAEPHLEVVGFAVSPEEAFRIVATHPVDIAVLGVDGAELGFVAMGRRLQELRPGLHLVGVAGDDDTAVLATAVRAGFRGWVPKGVGIGALLDALSAVSRGETAIPPALLSRLLPYLLHEQAEEQAAQAPLAGLTAREREVLRAMSAGATRIQIASQLSISSNTVRTHMQSILTKLGVHSSLAAVMIARRAGLS